MNKGVTLSFITVFLWAIYDVFVRFAGNVWQVEPFVFISFTNLFAALALLIVAGPGKLGADTIKQAHTWAFSFINIFMDIIFVFVLLLISTTEANFLIRFSIIMAMIAAWVFLSRKPKQSDIVGGLLILIGVIMVAMNLEAEIRGQAIFLILIATFCQTLRTIISEKHPASNKAQTTKDRCRVTGYVLLITSFTFLVFGLISALLKIDMPQDVIDNSALLNSLPTLSSFTHPATILAATILGIFNVSISNYFYFYATKTAKSETFLMVAAALPVLTYIFEYTASKFGLLDISSISNNDLLAGGIITFGAMYMVYMRHVHEHIPAIKAKRIKAKQAEKEEGISDYDMLCETLEFCNGSHEGVAKLLDIPTTEVQAVYEAQGKRKFKTTKGLTIGRNYHRNVASCDALTRLSKREVLLKAMNGAIKLNEPFTVMFIDLDKFKPVNDTYGHEAGNEILQVVADVLNVSTPKNSIVARVGGDEFVIMLRNPKKGEVTNLTKSIKQRLSTKFQVPSAFEAVQIGSSIGVASFPKDAKNSTDLLKLADSNMYLDKGDARYSNST